MKLFIVIVTILFGPLVVSSNQGEGFLLNRLDDFIEKEDARRVSTLANHIVNRSLIAKTGDFYRDVQFALPFWLAHHERESAGVSAEKLKRVAQKVSNSTFELANFYPDPLHKRWDKLSSEKILQSFRWLEEHTTDFAASHAACDYFTGRGELNHLLIFFQKVDFKTIEQSVNKMYSLRCRIDALLDLNKPHEAHLILQQYQDIPDELISKTARSFYEMSHFSYHLFLGNFAEMKKITEDLDPLSLMRVEALILSGDIEGAKAILKKLVGFHRDHPDRFRGVVKYYLRTNDLENAGSIARQELKSVITRSEKNHLSFLNIEELLALQIAFAKLKRASEAEKVFKLIDRVSKKADQRSSILGVATLWKQLAEGEIQTLSAEVIQPFIQEFGHYSKYTIDMTLLLKGKSKDSPEAQGRQQ